MKMRTIESDGLSHKAQKISLRNAGSRILLNPATQRQEQETKDLRHLLIAPPTQLVLGLLPLEHAMENR
jgi:hypothetical protein